MPGNAGSTLREPRWCRVFPKTGNDGRRCLPVSASTSTGLLCAVALRRIEPLRLSADDRCLATERMAAPITADPCPHDPSPPLRTPPSAGGRHPLRDGGDRGSTTGPATMEPSSDDPYARPPHRGTAGLKARQPCLQVLPKSARAPRFHRPGLRLPGLRLPRRGLDSPRPNETSFAAPTSPIIH